MPIAYQYRFSFYISNEPEIVLFLAIFGGMYGCAIGMSVAAAFEVVYWLTMKPLIKVLASPKPKLRYLIPTYIIALTVLVFVCSYIIDFE